MTPRVLLFKFSVVHVTHATQYACSLWCVLVLVSGGNVDWDTCDHRHVHAFLVCAYVFSKVSPLFARMFLHLLRLLHTI